MLLTKKTNLYYMCEIILEIIKNPKFKDIEIQELIQTKNQKNVGLIIVIAQLYTLSCVPT